MVILCSILDLEAFFPIPGHTQINYVQVSTKEGNRSTVYTRPSISREILVKICQNIITLTFMRGQLSCFSKHVCIHYLGVLRPFRWFDKIF